MITLLISATVGFILVASFDEFIEND
jgi:hypothetical protein